QQTHINEDEWQHLTFDYIMEMPEKVYRAVGCEECRHTGYKGRIGIYEFMLVSLELKHLISSHATLNELRSQTKKESVEPLRIAGARKVIEGLTTLEEVLRVVPLN
ncbi:ATPase, T2SS/T4P/T4SS family, partial [Pseudomonas aeruginosa]